MSRSGEQLFLCSCPSPSDEGGCECRTSSAKGESPSHSHSSSSSSSSFRPKFPLRHVILLVGVLTLSSHVHNANSQPLLNQLAVLLRARPPWPTSFPAAASQQQNKGPQKNQLQQPGNNNPPQQSQQGAHPSQQNHQQQQHQPSQSINNPVHVNPNSINVYATSAEQMQNFLHGNNLIPGLNQGIPVVAVDPQQNSITIVTPSGPDQISGPNPNGNVFVAQPFNGTGIGVGLGGANSVQNTGSSGPLSLFPNIPNLPNIPNIPNILGLDQGQNLLDSNILAAVPPQNQVPGGINPAAPQQPFPAGFLLNPRQPPNPLNINGKAPISSPGAPPPPPVPKNLKGPAIIAVPKNPPPPPSPNPFGPPPGNFLGNNNFQRFLPHHGMPANVKVPPIRPQNRPGPGPVPIRGQPILPNPAARPAGLNPPMLLQAALQQPHPQLPSIANGFRPYIPHPPLTPHSQEHLISLPENAIANAALNNTAPFPFPPFPPFPVQSGELVTEVQPTQPQFLKEVVQQTGSSGEQPQSGLGSSSPPGPQFPRERSTTTAASELPSDIAGNPRYQRKRQFKKQKLRQQKDEDDDDGQPVAVFVQYQHNSNRGNILNKFKAVTNRPTQIPLPSEEEGGASQHADVERVVSTSSYSTSPLTADYSLSTIINMPSTTITGSFEYPDPPTPPNYQSMNALKYPSAVEDSAEVIVKNIIPTREREFVPTRERDIIPPRERDIIPTREREIIPMREKPRLREQSKPNPMNPFQELKKRVRVGGASTHNPSAADSSGFYRSVTTASSPLLPSTRSFDVETDFRDTTTFGSAAIQSRDILSRIRDPRPKAPNDKSFRPSPQIHSFEEPVTGIRSYITILPPPSSRESDENRNERGKKSLVGVRQKTGESKVTYYEQGFKPVNHYTNNFGSGTMSPPTTTTETLYFDLIREAVSKAPKGPWDNDRLTVTMANPAYVTMGSSTSLEESFIKAGWKVRDGGDDDGNKRRVTTDSSERVEDWRHPDSPDGSGTSSKIYFGNGKFGPPNCDKFHRFGFCPMNSGYPTEQVEKIASRCSALLSHLIAPLPKADVRYDVIVAKNGSMLKGKSSAPSGWSWKTFSGKPVCDTKEIKVVPGWAKNEQGEWLVILQTKAWKQEAQITLCTPQGTNYNSCKGSNQKDCSPIKIKCVQRFTAQRLAVLDPENTDRCPVLRSVFLPSACVCLNDNSSEKGHSGRSDNSTNSSLPSLASSSEEVSSSSSNTNAHSVRTAPPSTRSPSRTAASKKGSKGKSSKGRKSSSSKRNKSSSGRHGGTPKSEENNSATSGSDEESRNKSGSDILDTAADSSTSARAAIIRGRPVLPSVVRPPPPDESESVEETNDVEGRPHAEPLVSSASAVQEVAVNPKKETEVESEKQLSSVQNEVEDNTLLGTAVSSGDLPTKIAKPTSTDLDEESGTTTQPPKSGSEDEPEKSENDQSTSSDEDRKIVLDE